MVVPSALPLVGASAVEVEAVLAEAATEAATAVDAAAASRAVAKAVDLEKDSWAVGAGEAVAPDAAAAATNASEVRLS